MKLKFKTPFYFAILILCLSLILSACGSDSKSSSGKGKIVKSAIEEELFGKTSAAEANKKVNDKTEEIVEKCMTDKGWEYYKQQSSFDGSGFGITYIDPNFADKAKREKYGYGLYTFTKSDGSSDDKALNEYYGGGASSDKNADYLNTLSAEEQARYGKDLYGYSETDFSQDSNQDSNSGDSDLDTGDGTTGGDNNPPIDGFDKDSFEKSCYGQASTAIYGDFSDLEKVGNELNDLNENFTKNKGVKAAAKEWKACLVSKLKKDKDKSLADKVAKKLTSPTTVSNDISGVIQPRELEDKSSVGSESDSISDSTVPTKDNFEGDDFTPPSYDKKDLESKQKFEVRLAALDYSCQEEKYLVPVSKIAREQEEKFVKNNKSTITKLKSTFEKLK